MGSITDQPSQTDQHQLLVIHCVYEWRVGSGLGNQHGVEVGSSYAAAAPIGGPPGLATPATPANQPPAGEQ